MDCRVKHQIAAISGMDFVKVIEAETDSDPHTEESSCLIEMYMQYYIFVSLSVC